MNNLQDIKRLIENEIDSFNVGDRVDALTPQADWHDKVHQSAQLPITLPRNHPFKISVTYSDDSSSAAITVHVLHGGFIWKDDGETKFAGTDASTTQEAFDLEAVDSATFEAGDEVWATLDISGSTPDAKLQNEALVSNDEYHHSVLIGKVSASGAILQYIFNHIDVGNSGPSQLDHSFLPIRLTDSTCSFLAGHVVMRNGTTLSVSPSNIDFSVNKYFWLVLDYSSASYSISNTLGASADAFPAYADWAGKKINIPLVSFVNNTFTSLKRYQTNDIIIPQAVDSDSGGSLKTIERSPSTDSGHDSAQIRNAVNAKNYQVPYLVPAVDFSETEWRWPVQGPGASASAPGSLSSQVVTSLTSASGSANATVTLAVKTRTHAVAEGAEVWGTESSETSVVGQVLWTGGTLYQVWQVMSGGYGWDWTRAHG